MWRQCFRTISSSPKLSIIIIIIIIINFQHFKSTKGCYNCMTPSLSALCIHVHTSDYCHFHLKWETCEDSRWQQSFQVVPLVFDLLWVQVCSEICKHWKFTLECLFIELKKKSNYRLRRILAYCSQLAWIFHCGYSGFTLTWSSLSVSQSRPKCLGHPFLMFEYKIIHCAFPIHNNKKFPVVYSLCNINMRYSA